MKLITKEIENKIAKYPLYSQDGKGLKAKVIAKFFNPCGRGTWIATEGEKQPDGTYLFFGYACIYEWEWGYFTQKELEEYRGPLGVGIERDTSKYDTVEDCLRRMGINPNPPRNAPLFKG